MVRTQFAAVVAVCLVLHGGMSLSADEPSGREPFDVAWASRVFGDYLATGHTPRPAVARIVAADGSGTSVGSGVLVDINATQGLVLTNWHVVREAKGPVLVQFPDGFQSAGTVLRQDADWDLAVLVIWKPDCEPVSIAPRSPAIGEPLTIAGYGRGHYREETGPCTQYLSPGSGLPLQLVELVATARQGDSGGPIFNERGELAGVLFGQGDGRTVGSCADRVRMFLTAVGSKGFDQGRFQLASASREAPAVLTAPRTAQPTAAIMPAGPAAAGPTTVAPMAEPPMATASTADAALPGTAVDPVQRILELVRTSPSEAARFGLSAVGGLVLVLLGLRGLFSGGGAAEPKSAPARSRTRSRPARATTRMPAPSRATTRWFDDDDDDEDDDDDDDDDE